MAKRSRPSVHTHGAKPDQGTNALTSKSLNLPFSLADLESPSPERPLVLKLKSVVPTSVENQQLHARERSWVHHARRFLATATDNEKTESQTVFTSLYKLYRKMSRSEERDGFLDGLVAKNARLVFTPDKTKFFDIAYRSSLSDFYSYRRFLESKGFDICSREEYFFARLVAVVPASDWPFRTKQLPTLDPQKSLTCPDLTEIATHYGISLDAAKKALENERDKAARDAALIDRTDAALNVIDKGSPAERSMSEDASLPIATPENGIISEPEQDVSPQANSLPHLSEEDLTEIQLQAALHPWARRNVDGRSLSTPYEWVRDHYGKWMGKGLMAHHLRHDKVLYSTLMTTIARARKKPETIPEWFNLPIERDQRLSSIVDPEERFRLEVLRQEYAKTKRATRNRARSGTGNGTPTP